MKVFYSQIFFVVVVVFLFFLLQTGEERCTEKANMEALPAFTGSEDVKAFIHKCSKMMHMTIYLSVQEAKIELCSEASHNVTHRILNYKKS